MRSTIIYGLILAFVLLVRGPIAAEDVSPERKGPFLGQKPPGMIPEIFAPGIVSTAGFEHSKIEFAKDGSVLYWAAQPEGNNAGSLRQKIWFVKRENDVWMRPEQLPVNQLGVRSPTIVPISNDILFLGSADTTATDAHHLKDDLFRIDREHKQTENISGQFPMLTKSWSFSFAPNGNLYYDYPEGDTYNIYCAEYKDGIYGPPQKLNASINDGNTSIHPCICPDESYLIFSSFRPGGRGIADLYISFRDKNGQWSDAQNMGDVINTDMLERFPSVSPDGKYLFFTRNKGEASDFYWVDAKVIEALRPKE